MTTAADFDVLIRERRAVKQFDPAFSISEDDIKKLLDIAAQAPSSFNLQHWRFLVVHDAAAKVKMLPAANNQRQISDASATIVVLGDLEAYREAEAVYIEAFNQGSISEEVKKSLVERIEKIYEMFPQAARDEAIRNASLAAMQLMMAAMAQGYDTCPMGGFDPGKLTEICRIPSRYVPVMLVAVGRAAHRPSRQSFRFPVERSLIMNSF